MLIITAREFPFFPPQDPLYAFVIVQRGATQNIYPQQRLSSSNGDLRGIVRMGDAKGTVAIYQIPQNQVAIVDEMIAKKPQGWVPEPLADWERCASWPLQHLP